MTGLVLRGPQLRLRSWRPEDVEVALGWANDPDSLRAEERWDPFRPWSREEFERAWNEVSSRGRALIGVWRRASVVSST